MADSASTDFNSNTLLPETGPIQLENLQPNGGVTVGLPRTYLHPKPSTETQNGQAPVLRRMKHDQTEDGQRKQRLSQLVGDKEAALDVYVQADSTAKDEKITKLRSKVRRMYQSPCELDEWSKRASWLMKLLIRLVKVVILTVQLSAFAEKRSTFVEFSQTSKLAFHHTFLKDWTPSETEVYALYTRKELFNHMNYVLSQYYGFSEETLTAFVADPNKSVEMRSHYYNKTELHPINQSYNVNLTPTTMELIKLPIHTCNCTNSEHCYDVEKFLKDSGQAMTLNRLIDVTLSMVLKGMKVKAPKYTMSQPVAHVECLTFNITIKYDHSRGAGQIPVTLTTKLDTMTCDGSTTLNKSAKEKNKSDELRIISLDAVVLLTCFMSFVMVFSSIISRFKIMLRVKKLFVLHYHYRLLIPEMAEFLNMWYFLNIASDVLAIAGTGLKLKKMVWEDLSENVVKKSDTDYNYIAILLGLANLSHWIGLIRYLGFFNRYNILILTISSAVPAVFRFMICCTTMYLGFVFAGWVMFGPYNPKFVSLRTTSETLFSLMNGDEIFATMSIIDPKEHELISWMSGIYLYAYVIMFLFVIANLFIAIITESYGTLKNRNSLKKTFLDHFIDDTLNEVGITREDCKVYRTLSEDQIDAQYGMLSPILGCLDSCVHHNSNVDGYKEQNCLMSCISCGNSTT